MNRLFVALAAYAVLATLAWFMISDRNVRVFPLALLSLLAMKSVLWQMRKGRESAAEAAGEEENGASVKR